MAATGINLVQDVYDFWGHRIGISSNAGDIRSHFRSVYSRFHQEEKNFYGNDGINSTENVACIIEAVDNIESSGELLVNDGKEFYSLRCKSLYKFDQHNYGKGSIADPISFVTYLLFKNKYRLIRKFQLIHAAAVTRNGHTVIFPGAESMGKTTLSVRLVQQGFKFLSDEVACIDPSEGLIRPYPRKLNINASSCALLNLKEWPDMNLRRSGTDEVEWAIDIEQIVPGSLSPAAPLTDIIFLRGFGEKPRLEPISPANALFRLFKYSFNPVRDPALLLFDFTPVVNQAACYNLICADLDETAELIVQITDE